MNSYPITSPTDFIDLHALLESMEMTLDKLNRTVSTHDTSELADMPGIEYTEDIKILKAIWPEMNIDPENQKNIFEVSVDFKKAVNFIASKARSHPLHRGKIKAGISTEGLFQINEEEEQVFRIYSPLSHGDRSEGDFSEGFNVLMAPLPEGSDAIKIDFKPLGSKEYFIQTLEYRSQIPGVKPEKILGVTHSGCVATQQGAIQIASQFDDPLLAGSWIKAYGYVRLPTVSPFEMLRDQPLVCIPETGDVFITADIRNGNVGKALKSVRGHRKKLWVSDMHIRRVSKNDIYKVPILAIYMLQLEDNMKLKYPNFKRHPRYRKALGMVSEFPEKLNKVLQSRQRSKSPDISHALTSVS